MPGARALRVLSLAPTSFFADYGCHVRILEEALALQRAAVRVSVLTYRKGGPAPGVHIIRTNPTPWHAEYEVGSSRHKYAFDVLLAIRLLRVLAAARRARDPYHVIHGHLHEGALIGGVVGRLFGVPTVMDYQGSLTDEMRQHKFLRPDGKRERFWRRVETIAERAAGAIVTSTQHAADRMRAAHPGKYVAALQDAVSTSFVRPDVITSAQRDAARARFGIPPDAPVLVFLGLLAEHQGLQNMIDAAALLKAPFPHARWLIYGYPAVGDWQLRAAHAGVADVLYFPGRVAYLDMPAALALGDVALAPKLSLSEGSGKLLNYMAMGLPTVAFDTPAQRELLGECGQYAPLGDTVAFAAACAELLQDPARARALGAASRVRAALFGWDAATQIMMEAYHHVVPTKA